MGINYPNSQSLIMLADFFNVSVDCLLGLDGREMPNISKLNDKEQKMLAEMVKYLSEN